MYSIGTFPKYKIHSSVTRTNAIFENCAMVVVADTERTIAIHDVTDHSTDVFLFAGVSLTVFPFFPDYPGGTMANRPKNVGKSYTWNPSQTSDGYEITVIDGGQIVWMYAAEEIDGGEHVMLTDLADHGGTIAGTHDGMISPATTAELAAGKSIGIAIQSTPENTIVVWSGVGGTQHTKSLQTKTTIPSYDINGTMLVNQHPSINWNGKWDIDDYHPKIRVKLRPV